MSDDHTGERGLRVSDKLQLSLRDRAVRKLFALRYSRARQSKVYGTAEPELPV